MIDYTGEVSTPTSDVTTMKIHVNIAISDVNQNSCAWMLKNLPKQPDVQG